MKLRSPSLAATSRAHSLSCPPFAQLPVVGISNSGEERQPAQGEVRTRTWRSSTEVDEDESAGGHTERRSQEKLGEGDVA